jgi:hypothetical protein
VHFDFKNSVRNLPFYLTDKVISINQVQALNKSHCLSKPYAILNNDSALFRKISNSNDITFETFNYQNNLEINSPNYLKFKVSSPTSAIFVTPLPNLSEWRLTIDHIPTEIVEVNGGFVGAPITSPGIHVIEFKFSNEIYKNAFNAFFLGLFLFFTGIYFLKKHFVFIILAIMSLFPIYWINKLDELTYKPVNFVNSYNDKITNLKR